MASTEMTDAEFAERLTEAPMFTRAPITRDLGRIALAAERLGLRSLGNALLYPLTIELARNQAGEPSELISYNQDGVVVQHDLLDEKYTPPTSNIYELDDDNMLIALYQMQDGKPLRTWDRTTSRWAGGNPLLHD